MDRIKRSFDNVDQLRIKQIDTYQTLLLVTQAKMRLLAPNSQPYVEYELELNANRHAFEQSNQRLQNHEQSLREKLDDLEQDLTPIRYLSIQSNVKNAVIRKQNQLLGWIPHTDSYVMIQNSTCPSDPTVLLQTSWEPESKLSNLPLSVFNLIHYADKIGATDDVLLQMLTTYLNKHKPSILETLDQRKNSLHAVIESLAFQCTTDAERATVQHKLRTFTRLSLLRPAILGLKAFTFSTSSWTSQARQTKFV